MAIDRAFHVQLGGKGYLLADESYAWQAQKPFNPRFSTGDPTIGDLSFWQFVVQESFSGGQGQELFSTITQYLQSTGWDFRDGKPRLAYDVSSLTFGTVPPIANDDVVVEQLPKVLTFAGDIYICYSSGAAFTRTLLVARNVANNQPAIYHVSCRDAIVMSRESGGTNTALAMVSSTSVRFVDGAYTTLGTVTSSVTRLMMIAQINANQLLLLGGNTSSNDGSIMVSRVTLTAGAWTESAEVTFLLDASSDARYNVLSGYAVDTDNTIYVGLSEISTNQLSAPFRLLRFTSTDLVAGNFAYSDSDYISGFLGRAIFDINGTVFIAGAFENIDGEYQRGIIKFPNTEIYRSTKKNTGAAQKSRHTVTSIFKSLNSAMLLFENDEGSIKTLLSLDSTGVVKEVASFNVAFDQDTQGHLSAFLHSGRFYLIDAFNQVGYRTGTSRGITATWFKDHILKLSSFGSNTPLILKSLYKVIVELSESLPTLSKMTVFVNEVEIGSITASKNNLEELIAKSAITSTSFTLKIKISNGANWAGHIKRIGIQFIPTQLKKLAWSFAIRADMSARLLSGQGDDRTADDIEQDVKAAWKSDLPVDFVDRDGREYKVIVTDVKGRVPLIGDDPNRRESIIPVEILEV